MAHAKPGLPQRNKIESKAYVGSDGPGQIVSLRCGRRIDRWRRSPCR